MRYAIIGLAMLLTGGRGTSLVVWNPVWEDVSRVRTCMLDKGYQQNMTAGEPDGASTKPPAR